MKHSFLLFILLLSIEGFPQITLDFQTSVYGMIPIKITNSRTKYFATDFDKINIENKFYLYNLDGSVYKTIQMPVKPDPSATIYSIYAISESLFDNDTSQVKYLVSYNWDSIPNNTSYQYNKVRVIREDGTILLDEMNAYIYFCWPLDFSGLGISVYNTEDGPRLKLNFQFANLTYYQTRVFTVQGQIPTGVQDQIPKRTDDLVLYPNPNNGSFFLKFKKFDDRNYMIDLYTIQGKFIETFKSSGNPTHINTPGLSEGTYLLNTRNNKGVNSTAKMIMGK